MSDLQGLYQELIIDHSKSPRNFGVLASPCFTKEGYNPLCGDKVNLYVNVENGIISQAKFEAVGCAISIASASMMVEALMKKNKTEFFSLFEEFHDLVTKGNFQKENTKLQKLIVFGGVSEFPMRVKCATMVWHTFAALIKEQL